MGGSRIVNQVCKPVKQITQGDVLVSNQRGTAHVMFIEWEDPNSPAYFKGVVIASDDPRLPVGDMADSFLISDFNKVDSVTICFE